MSMERGINAKEVGEAGWRLLSERQDRTTSNFDQLIAHPVKHLKERESSLQVVFS
jgi:hypothetical protein